MTNSIWIIAMLLAAVSLQGCGGRAEAYGNTLTDNEAVAVSAVLADPAAYNGQTVKIEGKIVSECMTGCWFGLEDDGVSIHVDIKPAGLAIPQRVGKDVVVEGTVAVEDNNVMFLGQGVEIR